MQKASLKREIGLLGLSANVVNIMVGAGIFALPALVAAGLGSASIYAYLFCGFLVTLVMLCFAEVGSKVTTSGGVYAYIHTAFGSYAGFLTLLMFGLSAISADAAVANAIGEIVGSLFPVFQARIFKILLFLILFSGLGTINVIGVKEGVGLVKIITIAKIIPLFLLVLFSWGEVTPEYLIIDTSPTAYEIGETSLLLFFAFQGAESALSVGGEVKNPHKTIPRAIFVGIAGVLILYILIQTVSQGVLGPALAEFPENPLSEVAKQVFGPVGFLMITIGAAISMFGNLSSEVLSFPRILYQAAQDNVLPIKKIASIHYRFATPYIAVIIYAGLGFVFASSGGFAQLAIISSAAMLLVYLGVCLSVIRLRKLAPANADQPGFTIPGGYTVPVAASLVIGWFLFNLNRNEIISIGVFIVALSIFFFINKNYVKRF